MIKIINKETGKILNVKNLMAVNAYKKVGYMFYVDYVNAKIKAEKNKLNFIEFKDNNQIEIDIADFTNDNIRIDQTEKIKVALEKVEADKLEAEKPAPKKRGRKKKEV